MKVKFYYKVSIVEVQILWEEVEYMNLFTENNSLKSMNEILVEQIPKYSLIGELPLSKKDFNYLDSTITFLYENDINTKNFFCV